MKPLETEKILAVDLQDPIEQTLLALDAGDFREDLGVIEESTTFFKRNILPVLISYVILKTLFAVILKTIERKFLSGPKKRVK